VQLIPLTRGLYTQVDDWVYEKYGNAKWHAVWQKNIQSFYAARRVRGSDGRKHQQFLHRLVLGLESGDRRHSDHINHDTLDNTGINLRAVTHQQNGCNRKTNRNNQYGHTGLFFRAANSYNPWTATLDFQGKRVLDNCFPTKEQAIAARLEAERKYFGAFALQRELIV
jgi:hypothetical protein